MRTLLLAAAGSGAGVILPPTHSPPSFYTKSQQTIPTYDGSGQATHPAVIKVPGGWNGYLYWMAMTPLPGNDETYEDPSVLVSNDGTAWAVPAGGSNPVVSFAGTGSSDPELAHHDGTLYLFWRKSGGGGNDEIRCRTSTNGITWSGDTTVLSGDGTISLLSPAVVRDRDGTWRMWAVNGNASPNILRMWTASDPLGPWSGPSACTATDPESRDLWHCDVYWDGTAYRMLLTTCGLGNSGDFARLLLGSSTNGTTWSFSNAVLSPSASGFDDYSTGYHGSGFPEQGRYRVWFGAQNTAAEWHIGYTEADPADFP